MIPKTIYQVSIGLNHTHPLIQRQIQKTLSLNPGYEYHLITEESEMNAFVNQCYPGEIANAYNRLNILVAKVDFWRYLMLYKNGGVYLDMDSAILQPLDDLIQPDDSAIITAEGNPFFFVQWALIYSAGHLILKQTIDFIVQNIQTNAHPNNIHKTTGPAVYSEAVTTVHSLSHSEDTPIPRDPNTDITYHSNGISYRIYGVDYGRFFQFKYPESDILYIGRKSWRQEEREKPLLR
jgi:mannosyltransferase OCH1-like enzyme